MPNHYDDLFFATIHELGHGLYDQHSQWKLSRTNLAWWVSLWIHESQARLLENMIGRSLPFLMFARKHIHKYFPKLLQDTSRTLYKKINHVRPSLNRIGADEISYNLHIIIRYEIEKELFAWTLSTKDVPHIWNQKMKEYLGIVPKHDLQWCLQDVHWSLGLFGYFPTYTLGNIIAAQLRDSFLHATPDRAKECASWNFSSYTDRFPKKFEDMDLSTHQINWLKKLLKNSYIVRFLSNI